MKHQFRLAGLILTLVAVAGCTEGPTAQPSAVSPDFADNPSSPSPIIIRRDNILVRIISVDQDRNLMAIHGPVDVSPCNNTTTKDAGIDGQRINTPSDAQGFRLLLQSKNTHVEIYQGTATSPVFPFDQARFCAFVANTVPLYSGDEVQYHVNLGSSMASFRWEGSVTRTSDGASLHYVENQDVVTNANGSNNTQSSIRVQ